MRLISFYSILLFTINGLCATESPNVRKSVDIGLFPISITNIDLTQSTAEIRFEFYQEWNEPQLRFDGKNKIRVPNDQLNNSIWTPRLRFDPFVDNSPRSILSSPMMISPNGNIRKSETLTATTTCHHNPGDFPSDTMLCVITIAPKHGDLNLIVGEKNKSLMRDKKFYVASPFQIERYLPTSLTRKYEKPDEEGVIIFHFEFVLRRRAAAYYWFSSVQPSLFFLVLTWISIFLNREKFILLRITLAFVSLIAVQALNYATNSVGRISERGNVLDVWCQVSSLLIFIVLIENLIIAILSTKRNHTSEDIYPSDRSTKPSSDVEKLPKAMDYLTKVFYPIIAVQLLIYVFIKV